MQRVGDEQVSILDLKALLQLEPFHLRDTYIIDEISRQILNNQILCNQ